MEGLVYWLVGAGFLALVLLICFLVSSHRKKVKKRLEAKRREERNFARVQKEALQKEMAEINQRRVGNKIRRRKEEDDFDELEIGLDLLDLIDDDFDELEYVELLDSDYIEPESSSVPEYIEPESSTPSYDSGSCDCGGDD